MSMTKADLVDLILSDKEIIDFKLSKVEVETIVSKFLGTLNKSISSLKPDTRIELRGFGTFGVKTAKAKIARNPKTGQEVNVPARNKPFFRAGRDLKLNVNK